MMSFYFGCYFISAPSIPEYCSNHNFDNCNFTSRMVISIPVEDANSFDISAMASREQPLTLRTEYHTPSPNYASTGPSARRHPSVPSIPPPPLQSSAPPNLHPLQHPMNSQPRSLNLARENNLPQDNPNPSILDPDQPRPQPIEEEDELSAAPVPLPLFISAK